MLMCGLRTAALDQIETVLTCLWVGDDLVGCGSHFGTQLLNRLFALLQLLSQALQLASELMTNFLFFVKTGPSCFCCTL